MMWNICKQCTMLLLLPVFFVLFSDVAMASVGVASEVSGVVELERSGDSFALVEGVNINAGDIVRTDDDASVQIDMDDGSMLSLGENSEIRVQDYTLREDKSVVSATVGLAIGWLRFAVAHLRSAGRYQIHMPTAVLGVRGTEGLLKVEQQDDDVRSYIVMDEGKVEVAERIEKGRLSGTRLFLKAGEFAERRRAGRLSKRHRAPAWLVASVSKRLKKRLVRRALFLKHRGVSPQRLKRSLRHRLIKKSIQKKKRQLRKMKYRQSREKFRKNLRQKHRRSANHRRRPNRR